jgi:hypothetical protein
VELVVHRQEEKVQRERGRCWAAARVTEETELKCLGCYFRFLFLGWAFSPNYTHVLSFFLLKNLDTKLNNK